MKHKLTLLSAALMLLASQCSFAQNVGINVDNPLYPLEVYDSVNNGITGLFTSNNTTNSILGLNGNSAQARVGLAMYRSGGFPKAWAYINSQNNYVVRMGNSGEHFVINPLGNIGISESSPGFPLNFASTLGDKISLYGNSGNIYGLGIQSHLLQMYSEAPTADIAFGTGSSAAFNEIMRVKGNGKVGIGTSNPSFQLHVYDTANAGYTLYAESNNPSASVIAVNGRNSSSSVGYGFYRGPFGTYKGQMVIDGNNDFHLSLAGSGDVLFAKTSNGKVGIGTISPQQNLSVNGGLNIDQQNANSGNMTNALLFGSSSGEGISSRRTSGGNQYGIDFYTNYLNRLSLTSSGKMGVGITNPTSKLEVRAGGIGVSSSNKVWEMNYDSTGTYFYIDELGAGRRLSIKNGGNVGIGTTNPTAPLDVSGNIRSTGNIFAQGDKSVFRSNTSVPQKLLAASGNVGLTLAAGEVTSLALGFETFSAPPIITVANWSGTGDMAKVVVTCSAVTTSGCTVNFYNPSSSSITFNGTFNFALAGPQ